MSDKIQITQATITPTCRKKGDEVAIDEALAEIKKKILFSMNPEANYQATFQIVATIER